MKNILKMFTINFLILSCFLSTFAAYLEPTQINGNDCFNLYEVADKKNGRYSFINDNVLGKGIEFYINDNIFTTYENSIVYKTSDVLQPMNTVTYLIDGVTIILPDATQKNDINEEVFYLTKKEVRNYFDLDIESQGIFIEEEKVPIKKPNGVSFEFLKENIAALNYESIGPNVFQYKENDIIINTVYFYADSIRIQWYNEQTQTPLNLLLEALFPNSYETISNNILTIDNEYDNRYIKTTLIYDYLEIQIKNLE